MQIGFRRSDCCAASSRGSARRRLPAAVPAVALPATQVSLRAMIPINVPLLYTSTRNTCIITCTLRSHVTFHCGQSENGETPWHKNVTHFDPPQKIDLLIES